jgi:hypothetical protein
LGAQSLFLARFVANVGGEFHAAIPDHEVAKLSVVGCDGILTAYYNASDQCTGCTKMSDFAEGGDLRGGVALPAALPWLSSPPLFSSTSKYIAA